RLEMRRAPAGKVAHADARPRSPASVRRLRRKLKAARSIQHGRFHSRACAAGLRAKVSYKSETCRHQLVGNALSAAETAPSVSRAGQWRSAGCRRLRLAAL